jgi:hypothetical protein
LLRAGSIAVGLLAAAIADVAKAQPIVTRFEVVESVISPNDGNTTLDRSRVRYTLTSPAWVSLIVFEADSITPVDTLRAPGASSRGTADAGTALTCPKARTS